MVADGKSVDEIESKVRELRGRETKTMEPIAEAQLFMLGNSEEWLLVKCPSPEYSRAIEIALRGIVTDVKVSDLWSLVKILKSKLVKSERNETDLADVIAVTLKKFGANVPQESLRV